MQKKMFLKLAGIRGDSKSPRHFGEIELSSFAWNSKHQQISGVASGKVSINDLTVTKQPDKTSQMLWIAWTTAQNFSEGLFTIEDISESGSLFRAVIFKLTSVLINSVSTTENAETVALNFETLKLINF